MVLLGEEYTQVSNLTCHQIIIEPRKYLKKVTTVYWSGILKAHL